MKKKETNKNSKNIKDLLQGLRINFCQHKFNNYLGVQKKYGLLLNIVILLNFMPLFCDPHQFMLKTCEFQHPKQ